MSSPQATTTSVLTALLPIMAVVVVACLVTGIAMRVLPLYVHQGLGLSTFVVGLVAGTQFAATLVSRLWAGRFADTRGPKPAVVVGLSVAGAAGLLDVLSVHLVATRNTSVAEGREHASRVGGRTGRQCWRTVMATNARVEDALSATELRAVSPALEEYGHRRLFGDLWKRPGLTPRDRSIVTVAALIAGSAVPDEGSCARLRIGRHVRTGRAHGLAHTSAGTDPDRDRRLRTCAAPGRTNRGDSTG